MNPPVYDLIGSGYDTTRRADPFIAGRLKELLADAVGGTYLDVACGTGNYTIALAAAGLRMVGVDQSATMIAAASAKSAEVEWHIGDVTALPFETGRFAGAICTLAIHHFADLSVSFRDIRRVMRRGPLVLFTATHEQMRRCWLSHYFPDAIVASIRQMPDLPVVLQHLHSAGFDKAVTEPYEIRPDLQDFFMYSGKHRPQIYLDPKVRAGISTFSRLASPAEVEAGCGQLARDIASGHIQDVIDSYRHDRGDYMFIVAQCAKTS